MRIENMISSDETGLEVSNTVSQELQVNPGRECHEVGRCFPENAEVKGKVCSPVIVVCEPRKETKTDEKQENLADLGREPKLSSPNVFDIEGTVVKPQSDHETENPCKEDLTQNNANGSFSIEQVPRSPTTTDERHSGYDEDTSKTDEDTSKTDEDTSKTDEDTSKTDEDTSKTDESSTDVTALAPHYQEPLSSPITLLKRRRRKQSVTFEMTEIQEIRVDKGGVRVTKADECATSFPELKATSEAFLNARNTSGCENRRRHSDTACLPSLRQRREIQKQWSNRRSSVPLINPKDSFKTFGSRSSVHPTPPSSPNHRCRSLTMSAWTSTVTTHQDHNAVENTPCRSLQGSHTPPRKFSDGALPPYDSSRNNPTSNSPEAHQNRMSLPWNEHIVIREKNLQVNDNTEKSAEATVGEKTTEDDSTPTNPDDEAEMFGNRRPRSVSMVDISWTAEEEKVLEANNVKERRRKSFEKWLTDKEREILGCKMSVSEKQREAKEEASTRRKQLRKGKSHDEWLREKASDDARKQSAELQQASRCSETKNGTNERQRLAHARYEKWLWEKEMQELKKEKEMLKAAEKKTMEMRKKYEEKERMRMNAGLKYSTGSVSG